MTLLIVDLAYDRDQRWALVRETLNFSDFTKCLEILEWMSHRKLHNKGSASSLE
jgi:hypothetical protein